MKRRTALPKSVGDWAPRRRPDRAIGPFIRGLVIATAVWGGLYLAANWLFHHMP